MEKNFVEPTNLKMNELHNSYEDAVKLLSFIDVMSSGCLLIRR